MQTIPVSGGATKESLTGDIAFHDVTFAYPTRDDLQVLTNVSFNLPAGTVAAFVGPSGGGKSTCINLVERFYDAASGSVQLDGMDIKTLDPSWLRRQIGLVVRAAARAAPAELRTDEVARRCSGKNPFCFLAPYAKTLPSV